MTHAYAHEWAAPRGRHHRRHGRDVPPWEALLSAMAPRRGRGGPLFGPGGPGFHHRRGGRARRGDVRLAMLLLLAEEPRNGYQLMQEIEQRSGEVWRPSPGSVYPALAQLEDEGLVRVEETEGGRRFVLLDAGRAAVEERDPDTPAPWDVVREGTGTGHHELRAGIREIAVAASQVIAAGDDAQKAQAAELLRDTRRALYRILAEDDAG